MYAILHTMLHTLHDIIHTILPHTLFSERLRVCSAVGGVAMSVAAIFSTPTYDMHMSI